MFRTFKTWFQCEHHQPWYPTGPRIVLDMDKVVSAEEISRGGKTEMRNINSGPMPPMLLVETVNGPRYRLVADIQMFLQEG